MCEYFSHHDNVNESFFVHHTFFALQGDAISRIININKKAMKEKIERTRNLSKPVTSPPPVQSHAFPQSSFQHAPKAENINTCSDAIYSSYESLMMVPHSAKPRSPTANVCVCVCVCVCSSLSLSPAGHPAMLM